MPMTGFVHQDLLPPSNNNKIAITVLFLKHQNAKVFFLSSWFLFLDQVQN